MIKTCFVIMAIGDQKVDGHTLSSEKLRKRYDHLIKESLARVLLNCEIIRADDVSAPGTITTDIITRLMHSDLVVADVSFPNPNVFYELGLRHSSKPGTILLRDKKSPNIPFDISQLRHICNAPS